MKKLLTPWQATNGVKSAIIRWSYLIIVIAASVTMLFLLKENRQIVADIQQDRVKVAFDTCLDQNARRGELLEFLKDEKASTPVAIRFINLLAPKRNCIVYVENLLGERPNEVP